MGYKLVLFSCIFFLILSILSTDKGGYVISSSSVYANDYFSRMGTVLNISSMPCKAKGGEPVEPCLTNNLEFIYNAIYQKKQNGGF